MNDQFIGGCARMMLRRSYGTRALDGAQLAAAFGRTGPSYDRVGAAPGFIRPVRVNEKANHMAAIPQAREEWTWRCLHCHALLTSAATALRCAGCGREYPVIAGLPILIREPAGYLRSELASLARISQEARQRRDVVARLGRDAGLPDACVNRHQDVINAEIARAEMFLAMLEPAARALGDDTGESPGVRRSGWTVDALLPYLLRDWTDTSELAAVNVRMTAALRHVFPDPSGKSLVFAACGAGGLLAEMSLDFSHILGFELALPVVAAARHLLDGRSLDLALPRSINQAGRITLRRSDHGLSGRHIELAAMDAFDTAFADGSIDCVVTSFLIDLMPEPLRLADEIHRILSDNGVWINYGPSGPLKALWRFDQTEGAAFFETAGFTVIATEAHRTTYLDLSRDCPAWSFQSHICYLAAVRKSGPGRAKPIMETLTSAELPEIIPQHFPGADLIQRRSLGAEQTRTALLRHEALPWRVKSLEISDDTARVMMLVDGNRTVREIAKLLEQQVPGQPMDKTIHAFARYFEQGLLCWRSG